MIATSTTALTFTERQAFKLPAPVTLLVVLDMSVRGLRKERRGGAKRINWEEFGESIVDSVLRALDYWCWEVSGDDALTCYSAHADSSLYELAEEFAEWSDFGITERDLELLREMPEDIYKKYDAQVRREIERVVEELREEVKQNLREVCKETCGSDEKCIEECIREELYGW